MAGAQVRSSAPIHRAASSVEDTARTTVFLLRAWSDGTPSHWARIVWSSPGSRASAMATRAGLREPSARNSATVSSSTLAPGRSDAGSGSSACLTCSGPKGVTQPGDRHRSMVRRSGAGSWCLASTTWVMVLGRPVVSFPAGAVWTSTRPSSVQNCARRRSAAATSCSVGNPDRGVTGLRVGSISA